MRVIKDILNVLTKRHSKKLFEAAQQIACDRSIPVPFRLLRTLVSLSGNEGPKIADSIQSPGKVGRPCTVN